MTDERVYNVSELHIGDVVVATCSKGRIQEGTYYRKSKKWLYSIDVPVNESKSIKVKRILGVYKYNLLE